MLEVIEAVDGPMESRLNLEEQVTGEKFTEKIEEVYEKAVNQAKSVFEKAKFSTLLKD